MKKPAIFCDFDGTITAKDNIIAIMKHFAPPEWDSIKDDILEQRVSIREGVENLFSLLPTSLKEDIISFAVGQAVIRDGFRELVEFAAKEGIPFYIVSGGIDFFVHPILEGFGPFDGIYCNGADFSTDKIKILWPNSCSEDCQNDCGCCKPTIIKSLAGEEYYPIVIGDSITDLEAAKLADFVLARDFLADKCHELQIPFQSFESFHDCIKVIKERLEVSVWA
jgi:2-hydroxy-3-keto-5-methylthiopentenyl-1-phosphate phosphatase